MVSDIVYLQALNPPKPTGKKNAKLYGIVSTRFEGKITMAAKPTVRNIDRAIVGEGEKMDIRKPYLRYKRVRVE